jgi:hypothetical protein
MSEAVVDITGRDLNIGDRVTFESNSEMCLGEVTGFTKQSIIINADWNGYSFRRVIAKRLADHKIYKL